MNQQESTTRNKHNLSQSQQMKYTSSLKEIQRKFLFRALNKQQYADVTFIIGEQKQEYNLNRIFLSMISPVFNAMLFGSMKESQPNSDVIIHDMEPQIFECIIKFAYCNDPKVTSCNVLSVIQACDKYQIKSLSDTCYQYLQSCINDKNFCRFCLQAIELNIFTHTLQVIMKQYLSKHWTTCLQKNNFCLFFSAMVRLNLIDFIQICRLYLQMNNVSTNECILKSNGFTKVDLKTMTLILQTEPCRCNEEILWDMVVRWALYQSNIKPTNVECKNNDIKNSTSQQHKLYLLKSIRYLIRFALMSSKYFATKVVPLNVLTQKELIIVLMYFAHVDGGCGQFRVDSRETCTALAYLEMKAYPKNYTLKQFVDDVEDRMMVRRDEEKEYTPNIHIWVKFLHIKQIYPIITRDITVTEEDFKGEDMERWVEVPSDYLHRTFEEFMLLCAPIHVEIKQDNNCWPRAKDNNWRETLQIGDIIDVKDRKGDWYESLIRYVFPHNSDKAGKCVVHYIGWNSKFDEILIIYDVCRLAKRHTHTKGPHISNKLKRTDTT
eukprot:127617_1